MVNTVLRLGWQPLGGVAIGRETWTDARKGTEDGVWLFAQALVLTEEGR